MRKTVRIMYNPQLDTFLRVADAGSFSKLRPITYDPVHHGYYEFGNRVGNAFNDGIQLK